MPAVESTPFSYLIVRIVPDVERGERINAGVVLFCRQRGFLGAEMCVDRDRLVALGALAPETVASIAEHLQALAAVARGDGDAGPIAALPQSERFGWLAAPSSTIVQPSTVHTGLCADPRATLDELFARLVATGS